MKSFALAAVLGLASASYGSSNGNYGTTGHYGNQYGHAGRDDHDHNDHIYGYDSVQAQKAYRAGAMLARNGAINTSIQASVLLANTSRTEYLTRVRDRRIQRFQEIFTQNNREISAPFDYQTSLINKEIDDVTLAMTEALQDSNDAFTDMIARLNQLSSDKISGLQREIDEIKRAIERATVDKKPICKVIRALRADILNNITCDATTVVYDITDVLEFRVYEGMFDDFHYDIGHGKGTGEGSIDSHPVKDGYGGSAPVGGPVGDYEMDIGAPTRSWEGNLYAQGGKY